MIPHQSVVEALAKGAREVIESRQAPAAASFLAAWPEPPPARAVASRADAVAGASATEECAALPVLRWLPKMTRDRSASHPALISLLDRHSRALRWRQTYADSEMDAAFASNYGYTELMGANSLPSERLACGFLLLGPHTCYPSHWHEAEELYVPLSGSAHWQQGDGRWRRREPGSVVHHASGEMHAMRTQEDALLAVYAWLSRDLRQKARLAGNRCVAG